MQFTDLAAQQKQIRDKIESNIQAVLDHGQYILGPEIGEQEQRLAEYVGVEHAVACSSGTDALLLALMAYNVGPGDAVLTSPFTFIATAEVISLLGATPVFADIDPKTFNIDPEHLERALTALQDNSDDYPKPLHLQPAFKELGYKEGDFPISEDYSQRIFSLPMHPYLESEDQVQIVSAFG